MLREALLLIFIIILSTILYSYYFAAGKIYALSIDSTGRYVLSTDLKHHAILWDLKLKSKKVISHSTNIYSAYFIKHSNNYMWQDLNNMIYINDLKQHVIKSFVHFPTYGHIITTDLLHYDAADCNWNIYANNGKQLKVIQKELHHHNFFAAGKLLNLHLADNNKFFLSAGANFANQPSIIIRNIITGKILFHFAGLVAKTNAAISPDSNYFVIADENANLIVWDLHHIAQPKYKITATEKLAATPNDFYQNSNLLHATVAIKFIDLNGDYLRFLYAIPYAILYNVKSAKPKAYLFLGRSPYPNVNDYSRNLAIDTAPAAQILVIAKAYQSGMMVYQFDPKALVLKKIWQDK